MKDEQLLEQFQELSVEKSDLLCMAATGGAVSTRTLYSNDDETMLEFKLSSWKSLDIYMRRKGFSWDGENKRYIPNNNKTDNILEELASDIPVKAEQIIRKFELRTDIYPRELAKDMGFDSHREMAEYMEQKGL